MAFIVINLFVCLFIYLLLFICIVSVFVQNRAKREDFTVLSVKKKCQVIEKTFKDSNLLFTGEEIKFFETKIIKINFFHCSDGISLKNSTYPCYQSLNDSVANYFVLPDMKPRGYKSESIFYISLM